MKKNIRFWKDQISRLLLTLRLKGKLRKSTAHQTTIRA